MSDSNPPSGSPEPVSSPMSCLTCLQSSPSRLSLWTVLILSTSWVAVCPEAHDKHRFPSLLGVCTSGKSCRGFVPLHAVVYPLRKREMRPGRTQDSCRCLGPELLWTWALCSSCSGKKSFHLSVPPAGGQGCCCHAVAELSHYKGPPDPNVTMRTLLSKFFNYFFI